MAAAQLSSSPLIKQLVSQHSGQRSSKAYHRAARVPCSVSAGFSPERGSVLQHAREGAQRSQPGSALDRIRRSTSFALSLRGSSSSTLRSILGHHRHLRSSHACRSARYNTNRFFSSCHARVTHKAPKGVTNSPLRPPHGLSHGLLHCAGAAAEERREDFDPRVPPTRGKAAAYPAEQHVRCVATFRSPGAAAVASLCCKHAQLCRAVDRAR